MKKVTIFDAVLNFTDKGTLSSITITAGRRKHSYTLKKTPEIIHAVRATLTAFAEQDAVDLLQHGCMDISEDLMSRLVSATKGDLDMMRAAALLLDTMCYHREVVSTFDKLVSEEQEAEEQRKREAEEREYEEAARELAAMYLDACTLEDCRKWREELIDAMLRGRRLHMDFQEDLAFELDLDLDEFDPRRTSDAFRYLAVQAQDEKDLARLKSRYVAAASAPDMQRVQMLLESGMDVRAVAEGLAARYEVDTLPAAWRDLLVYVDCYDAFLSQCVDPAEVTSAAAAYAAEEAARAEELLRMEKVGACSQTAEIDFTAELPAEVPAAVPTPPALPEELPAGAVRVQIGRRTWTFSSFDAAAAAFAAEAARRAEAKAASEVPPAVPAEVPAETPAEVSAEVPAEERKIGGLFCRAEAAAAAAEKDARLAAAAARRAVAMEKALQRQLQQLQQGAVQQLQQQGSVVQLAYKAGRRIRSIGRHLLTKSTAAVAAAVAAFH